MRFALVLASLAALTACATAAPTPAAPSAPVAAATSAPSGGSRASQVLTGAGGPHAASRADIERAFGPADIARQDGAGASLTYRLDTCALMLLFAPDARNTMRLSEAHASARRPADAAPSLDQCATEASARRHS